VRTRILAHRLAFAPEDFRIEEDPGLALVLGHVNDDEPVMPVHLGSGQADSGGGIHGLEHVGDLALQRRIEHGHRRCLGAQPWIGILKNCELGHGLLSTRKCC
jgi:hypothetical protein